MMRATPGVLRQALFSALGLMPLACGETVSGSPSTGGSTSLPNAGAGSSPGGATGSGGQGAGGGGTSSAGTSPAASGSGGATAAGAGGAGASGGAAAEPPFPCEGSVPVGGAHVGFEKCGESNVWHRPTRIDCPEAATPEPLPEGYGCVNDADCGPGKICVCGQPSTCVEATCAVDADCGAGFVCRGYAVTDCEGQGAYMPDHFACQTAGDVCATFFDCEDGMRCGGGSGTFQCDVAPVNPACGRPFLVQGAQRVANLQERPDWGDGFDAQLFRSELSVRAGAAWARIAQLEHASVGAFARFTLQLLALGAPAELVERASRAMQDEVRHARLAFAIASRCVGRTLGPGPLDVARSLDETALSEVVRLALREGCVGETVAALQAQEAAAHVALPELRTSLERLASDEAEHAELAWRFVSWALEQDPSLSSLVQAELQSLRHEASSTARSASDDDALLAFGVLSETTQAALRRAALQEIVEPCALALLSKVSRRSVARIDLAHVR